MCASAKGGKKQPKLAGVAMKASMRISSLQPTKPAENRERKEVKNERRKEDRKKEGNTEIT